VAKYFSHTRIRVPGSIGFFFIKAIGLFIAWKVAYLAYLRPKRILDEPLTHAVGVSTTKVLNGLAHTGRYTVVRAFDSTEMDGGTVSGYVMDIYRNGVNTLRVTDACNGLELMVLYLGFLICFPAPLARKLWFAGIGVLSIFVLNVIRCTALMWISLHYPTYLDFSHHFVFTFIVYAFIFFGWFIFTKNLKLNGRSS